MKYFGSSLKKNCSTTLSLLLFLSLTFVRLVVIKIIQTVDDCLESLRRPVLSHESSYLLDSLPFDVITRIELCTESVWESKELLRQHRGAEKSREEHSLPHSLLTPVSLQNQSILVKQLLFKG